MMVEHGADCPESLASIDGSNFKPDLFLGNRGVHGIMD